jgi:chaperone modulatory protein CbpM
MSTDQPSDSPTQPQLIEGEALHIEEMAKLCCVSTQWIHTRIEQEVIDAVIKDGQYYFTGSSVVRVEQLARIEQTYDADPQLAALVADLIEEVRNLRRQLNRVSSG